MEDKKNNNTRIRLGISQGDINGIGYEVILKTFSDSRMFDICTPILYGSTKVASYHKKLLALHQDLAFNGIHDAREAADRGALRERHARRRAVLRPAEAVVARDRHGRVGEVEESPEVPVALARAFPSARPVGNHAQKKEKGKDIPII